jgi:hypothetical protein
MPAKIQQRGVCRAHIAQSVEHFLGKEEVTGSNPVMSSNRFGKRRPLGASFGVFRLKAITTGVAHHGQREI